MADLAKALTGKDDRLFAEAQPGPDETAFQIENTSEAYYKSPYYEKHKEDVQKVPPPRVNPPRLDLADVLGQDILGPIVEAKKLSFHAVGDTGAAKVNRSQKMATAIRHEAGVADRWRKTSRKEATRLPPSSFISATSSTTSARASTTTTSSTSPSGTTTGRSSPIAGNHDGDGLRAQPRHALGNNPDRISAQLLRRDPRTGRGRRRADRAAR